MNKLLTLIVAIVITGSAASAIAVEVQEVTSPGGIRALLVEDHANPIIAVRIAFRGGSALDPDGMEGLANMVSGLIDEGSGHMDSQAFQGRLEDLSIRLNFSSGLDTFRGKLTTLTENQVAAFEMLRLALTEPRFDDEPVARIRSQIMANLRNKSQDPDSIAADTLFVELFGQHPYAKPGDGTEESISTITSDAMKQFVARRFARDNLVVGVTGDITPATLEQVLDEVFGALPTHADAWELPKAQAHLDGGVHVKDLAVPQSAVIFAQGGIERSHPDFYAAHVLNYVLGGGGLTSRLYNEVREKRGLAYSAYSYLSPYDYAALIIGGAGTANERVSETISVIREQWLVTYEKGLSETELTNAKTYLTGSYPLRFSSNGSIAGMLVGIQMEGLGSDYFEKRNSYIDQVSLADVNRVARTLLAPDSLTFVVVGQPTGLGKTQ
jgi:zinc protease